MPHKFSFVLYSNDVAEKSALYKIEPVFLPCLCTIQTNKASYDFQVVSLPSHSIFLQKVGDDHFPKIWSYSRKALMSTQEMKRY